MRSYVHILLCCFFVWEIGFGNTITPVAVNELTGTELTSGELTTLSNRLRSELIKTGQFKVMERAEMNAILAEQGFQQSGACDEASCVVEVGRLLGVQKIAAGSVGRIGTDFYTISLRLIDVSTGEISKSADYDFTGELSGLLTTGLEKAALILAGIPSIEKQAIVQQNQVLTITSNPDSARITIGSLSGITPFTGTIAPGTYRLSINRKGFSELNQAITVSQVSEEPFSLQYSLTPKRKGYRTRVITLITGTGAMLGGLIFNSLVRDHNKNAADLQGKAASEFETSANAQKIKQDYSYAVQKGSDAKEYRTISYAIAATSFSLWGVTFAFGGKK